MYVWLCMLYLTLGSTPTFTEYKLKKHKLIKFLY